MTVFGQARKFIRQAGRAADPETKIELYSQALALEPENLNALFYRALAKSELGDLSGAIVDYSKIILIKPDADTYLNRANARYSLKNLEGAKADYEKALEIDPDFIDARFSLGCVQFDLQNYKEAIADFNKVVKQDPLYPKVYTLRATAYNALEEYKEALKDYTSAILISGTPEDFINRGKYFLDIHYYKEAYIDFNQALKADNSNPFGYFFRGTSALLLGGFDEAISDYNKALSYDSQDFDSMLGLALSYLRKDDPENAKQYFDKAKNILKISSEDPEEYKNTFWYQNQYYFFVNKLRELQAL